MDSMDMSLSKLREVVKDRKPGVLQFMESQRVRHNLVTEQQQCIEHCFRYLKGFPCGSDGRVCLQCRRPGFDPWAGNIPWRREWLPTSVF